MNKRTELGTNASKPVLWQRPNFAAGDGVAPETHPPTWFPPDLNNSHLDGLSFPQGLTAAEPGGKVRILPLLLSVGFRQSLYCLAARVRRRHLLIPLILAAQTLLLGLIFLNPRKTERRPTADPPVSMFNVQASANKPAETAPQPEPEPVRLERPTPEIELAVETIALPTQPVFSAAAAESAGFGTTCDVSGTLARAFGENEFIKGELARIGPESRSISNAIMFWNAAWVELPGDAPKDAVEMLRRAIVEGVRAAPPECLAQELAGPRFIIVGDTSRATMLVLGSGTWRWEQLLKGVEDGPHLVPPTQLERKD